MHILQILSVSRFFLFDFYLLSNKTLTRANIMYFEKGGPSLRLPLSITYVHDTESQPCFS